MTAQVAREQLIVFEERFECLRCLLGNEHREKFCKLILGEGQTGRPGCREHIQSFSDLTKSSLLAVSTWSSLLGQDFLDALKIVFVTLKCLVVVANACVVED